MGSFKYGLARPLYPNQNGLAIQVVLENRVNATISLHWSIFQTAK